jgi:NADH-quinone oxidoreductase subunit E
MPGESTATADIDLSGLDELLDTFIPSGTTPNSSLLIPVLQSVQERYGWLSSETLERVSSRLQIPLSQVYGVVTFYAQFYLEPRGRHTVRCCRGTACHVRGASNVLATIEQVLGVSDGETTPDLEFTVETVACLGTCFLAPVMMIDENYYGKLDSARVRSVFEEYRRAEEAGEEEPQAEG